jgi:hypothetical protein
VFFKQVQRLASVSYRLAAASQPHCSFRAKFAAIHVLLVCAAKYSLSPTLVGLNGAGCPSDIAEGGRSSLSALRLLCRYGNKDWSQHSTNPLNAWRTPTHQR